ncbi:MAG: cation transporter [Bacteroidetes bacterium HGW-Bacteroidetes-6]|nr:MAG: cation transporter [Bacteroidetes bacterium HGW-Bacteroidetes-6]
MTERTKLSYRAGIVSLFVNLILFVFKYYAGIISGSVALIADAWHTLSDSLTSLIMIGGVKLSSKKATPKHPFGYGRWEQIAAVFIAFVLAIVAYEFGRESLEKLSMHETANFGTIALIATITSIVVKEALAQYAFFIGRKTKNTSVRADAWHHRSDALSSVIVLVGILIQDYFWWIDGALGLAIAGMLFYAVFDIMKEAINKLIGEKPEDELVAKITALAIEFGGEKLEPHHFHIHTYGEHRELTFHIKIDGNMPLVEVHALADGLEKMIRESCGMEATIHADPA